ncbi:MAG TPA: sporulation integral membrane protein YtvI [Mobilitalea sp.]|nr:sporulation integral membrane protein YtvI [Mobilitalea sp.]
MKFLGLKSYQIRWFLTIALITLGVYLGLKYLLPLIFPFLVAYFIAWIIRPVTELLYNKLKIPRVVGGSAALILLVAVFGTALCMLINVLIRQAFEFVKNIPIYLEIITDKLDSICRRCDQLMGCDCGTVRAIVDDHLTNGFNNLKSNLVPKLTGHTITITIATIAFIGILLIIFVAAVLIVKDLPVFHEKAEKNQIYKDIHRVTEKLSEAGLAYLRCQLIIMIIVAVICILGLTLIKNNYAVLIGIGIAIMDALPILGSGIVLVPWGIIVLINGNIYVAAILITTFLLAQIVREILEPKLIGNRIGIKPIFTLIAMYIGVKLFSIAGFILGPIGLIIIITIFKVVNEKTGNTANQDNVFYNED